MHNDRAGPHLVQKGNICGKGIDIICRAHGMTTKFDDQRLVRITAHEGQRFDQHAGLFKDPVCNQSVCGLA